MSQRTAESLSQQDIYGGQGMHYMASNATTSKTDEDLSSMIPIFNYKRG
jgi:hypothetical protein